MNGRLSAVGVAGVLFSAVLVLWVLVGAAAGAAAVQRKMHRCGRVAGSSPVSFLWVASQRACPPTQVPTKSNLRFFCC